MAAKKFPKNIFVRRGENIGDEEFFLAGSIEQIAAASAGVEFEVAEYTYVGRGAVKRTSVYEKKV